MNIHPLTMPNSFLPWSKGQLAILSSLALAFLFSALPLPAWLVPLQPCWVPMVLIYWCMATPQITGVGVAWACGIISDVLHGSLLGQHALAYALVAWLTLLIYQRIRLFPLVQQAASVFLLLAMYQGAIYAVLFVQGVRPGLLSHWLPVLISALLWPWLFMLLRNIRRGA